MASIADELEVEEYFMSRENLMVPLEYTKLLVNDDFEGAEMLIQDEKNKIYAKAIHGQQTLNFKNGSFYQGEIFKGMMHGKGSLKQQSGITFKGDFIYNIMAGKGELFWPDGSYYIGEIKQNLRHGTGTFIEAQNRAKYVGQWEQGLRSGKGKLEFPSRASYEGDFKNGLKDGQGIFKYSSGNYYEGEFKKDAKHGKGVMHWLDVNEKYSGYWENNFQNGFGEHIWLENKGEKKQLRNRYEGQWKKGERFGYGIFYYADGSTYCGEWIDNFKEGYGMFTGIDGSVIQGYYKADKLVRNIFDQPMYASINFDDIPIIDSQNQSINSTNTPNARRKKVSQRLDKNNNSTPNSQFSNKQQIIPQLNAKIQQLQSVYSKKQSAFKPLGSLPEIDETRTNPENSKNSDLNNNKMHSENSNKIIQDQSRMSNIEQGKKLTEQSRKASEETPTALMNKSTRKSAESRIQQQSEKVQNQLMQSPEKGNQQKDQVIEGDVQDNPYIKLLDFSDLDINFTDPKVCHHNIEKILLRNNTQLIHLFRECSIRFDSILGESSFSMDIQQVWRFLKEIKVLGESVTLSTINRSFARGNKNRFKIKNQESTLIEEINQLKAIGRFVTEEERKNLKLVEYLSQVKKQNREISLIQQAPPSLKEIKTPDQYDQDFILELSNQGDVHSEEQAILFRHFVEILVRVAFLRSNYPDQIHIELEKIIEIHIKPWIDNRKKSKIGTKNSFEDEIQVLGQKTNILKRNLQKEFLQIFNFLKKQNKTTKFGSIDETCFLKDIIMILKNENLLKTDGEQQFIISILEQDYDQRLTLGYIDVLIKERDREREKEQMRALSKRNQKLPPQKRKKTPNFRKMKDERVCKVLVTELILTEFIQIILMFLIKQAKEVTPKIDDDTLEKKIRIHLEKIIQNLETSRQTHRTEAPLRKWPESIKDLLKVQKQKEKIKKDEMEREKKRKEDEKRREQRERAQMELQDLNIFSDIEDESSDGY